MGSFHNISELMFVLSERVMQELAVSTGEHIAASGVQTPFLTILGDYLIHLPTLPKPLAAWSQSGLFIFLQFTWHFSDSAVLRSIGQQK